MPPRPLRWKETVAESCQENAMGGDQPKGVGRQSDFAESPATSGMMAKVRWLVRHRNAPPRFYRLVRNHAATGGVAWMIDVALDVAT